MSDILHWQIASPFGVQGWIGGSRRIRDFWASSFLTSWLSACAMKALVEGGYGRIVFPAVDDDPLWRVMNGRARTREEKDWFVGTLPNRFKAVLSDPSAFEPGGNDPCSTAIRECWQKLAQAVWNTFLAPAAVHGNDTQKIWDRQIENFWEVNWVLGKDPEDGSDGAWLDRRKNWRAHLPGTAERGDHCRMLGDFQELSGFVRARGESRNQAAFWETVRQQVKAVVNPGADDTFELLEIRPTERLCAPALVKRLFPCLPAKKLAEVLGWVPQGLQKQRGNRDPRELPARVRLWPSTAYVAAAPWMLSALKEVRAAAKTFENRASSLLYVPSVAEHGSYVASFDEAETFAILDGSFFFDDMLQTEARNLRREGNEDRAARVDRVREALRGLLAAYRQRVGSGRAGRRIKLLTPSPFYALLMMDGDAIGKLLGKAATRQKEKLVSDALRSFGGVKVENIVERHDGTLIYAGGDDVKAFLPLTTAIPCAIALHEAYLEAMAPVAEVLPVTPTISAGLVFAHYHVPLSSVIHRAHALLDKTAKDSNGRNSIAISVEKPSGTMAEYVTSFVRKTTGDREKYPIDHMQRLASKYAEDIERSTSFLYNMKDRYEHVLELFGNHCEKLKSVMLAEWVKGKKGRSSADERRIDQLLDVCMTATGGGKTVFRIEGGLIARFLADNGVGTLDGYHRSRGPSPVPAGDGA